MPQIRVKDIPYTGTVDVFDTQPIGEMIAMPDDKASPLGYLPCDGRSVLRTQYPDLFKLIGTTYGAIDDLHFNLPKIVDSGDIDDSKTGLDTTWSSNKISNELGNKNGTITFNDDGGAFGDNTVLVLGGDKTPNPTSFIRRTALALWNYINDKVITRPTISGYDSVYSSNAYTSGYFQLVTINGGKFTGNHDNAVKMTLYFDDAGGVGVEEIFVYVRARDTTLVNSMFYAKHIFGSDKRPRIVVTRDFDGAGIVIKVYVQVTANWQKVNFEVNYLTNGDVSTRQSNNSILTYNLTHVDNVSGTQITRLDQ